MLISKTECSACLSRQVAWRLPGAGLYCLHNAENHQVLIAERAHTWTLSHYVSHSPSICGIMTVTYQTHRHLRYSEPDRAKRWLIYISSPVYTKASFLPLLEFLISTVYREGLFIEFPSRSGGICCSFLSFVLCCTEYLPPSLTPLSKCPP